MFENFSVEFILAQIGVQLLFGLSMCSDMLGHKLARWAKMLKIEKC